MACPEAIMSRETEFLAALQEMQKFSLDSDSMRLLDAHDNVVAQFVKGAE